VLQQQLRVGGLALATAAATATLALVTFLVTNLVLAVVAGLGGVVPEAGADSGAGGRDAVQGVLLSGELEESDGPVCRRVGRESKDRPVRCHERRASTEADRP
jgi:hypothetical protein